MEKHLDEKSLMVVKEKSIFYRIKSFFLKLFRKNAITENQTQITNEENYEVQSNKQKDSFVEYIRNIENEETKLLKLQKQFDNGEINKNQLSEEQIADLTALYKKQISNLKESNEKRIEKIRQRKDGADFLKSIKNIENEETKLLKLQKQYDNRLIETNDLSKDQIKELINLYKKQISELRKSNEIRKEKLLLYRKNMQSA